MTSYEMVSLEWRVKASHQEAIVAMQRFCDTLKPSEKSETKEAWEKR